jgi:solute:Na+ symporter, SSS family
MSAGGHAWIRGLTAQDTRLMRAILTFLLLLAHPLAALDAIGSWSAGPATTAVPVPGSLGAVGGRWLLIPEQGPATAAWVLQGASWTATVLPRPAVGGVCAPTGGELAIVTDTGAWILGGVPDAWTVRDLPRLPEPRPGAGAAVMANRLYVLGGGGHGWDISLMPTTAALAWAPLPRGPADHLTHSVVVAQDQGVWMVGGRDGQGVAQASTTVWQPKPILGRTEHGWLGASPAPRPVARGAALIYGQTHVLVLVPGENAVAGLLYHTVTDRWMERPLSLPGAQRVQAVAGASPGMAEILIDAGGLRTLTYAPAPRGLHMVDYTLLALYLAAMAGIGLYFMRRQTSTAAFTLGDRNVGWIISGISLYATGSSAISMMSIPAQTYAGNLVFLLPVFLTVPMALLAAFWVIPLLRRLDITSTYEYLERRFAHPLRLLGSAQSIVFHTVGRMAMLLYLPALAIASITGMDIYLCIALMGVLTTFYTAIGGLEAVIWTDVIQAGLMLLVPVVAAAIVISNVDGGLAGVIDVADNANRLQLAIVSWDWTMPVLWVFVVSVIMGATGFAGDQAMLQRVICTPDARAATKATVLFAIIALISGLVFFLLGTLLFAYFASHPAALAPDLKNDQIVPWFIVSALPVGVAGLFLAGIFAASMSTLSGTLNSVATLIVQDFVGTLRPQTTDAVRLRLLKWLSLGMGLISTGIAMLFASLDLASVWDTWNILVALIGGGFVGMYTLGMFTRRTSAVGAFIGALASVAMALFLRWGTDLHWATYGPGSIIACVVVGYAASFVFPRDGRSLAGLTVFDRVR